MPVTLTQQYGPTSLAFRAAQQVNVKNTALLYGGSVVNAYGDGASHPLSGIFPNLAAARTVFPSATALTDEIDYWVIQTYLVDGNKVFLPKGTYVLHGALSIPNGIATGLAIIGEGKGITVLTLRNSSQSNASIIVGADWITNSFNYNLANAGTPCHYVTIRDLTIDGNKANVTSTTDFTYGIALDSQYDLTMENVEVRNVNGWGVRIQGNISTYVQRGRYTNISCHDNAQWGFALALRYRKVYVSGIVAMNNGTSSTCGTTKGGTQTVNFGGIYFDCSEMQVDGIQAHGNNGDGVYIRNVFACQFSNIRSTFNGGCGIHSLACVDSQGSSWLAENNGTNPGNGQVNTVGGGGSGTATGGYDIWFDDSTYGGPGYGITNNTIVTGVRCGLNSEGSPEWVGVETYGLYIDDGIGAKTLTLTNVINSSTLRLPAGGSSSVNVSAQYYTKLITGATWTCPATGTYRVRAISGGGGGGGGGGGLTSQSGGGGGGAGIAVELAALLNAGEVYTPTIGAGGTGGTGASGAGGTGNIGGNTLITGTSINVYASGSGGGGGALANSTAVVSGGIPGAVGTGAQHFPGFGGTTGSPSGGALPHGSIAGGAGASASASNGGNGGPAGAYTAAQTAQGSGVTGTINGGAGSNAAANTGHGGGGGGGAFTAGTGGTGGTGGSGYIEIWQIA